MSTPFSEGTEAVAELIRAIAWPGAFLFLVLRYRDHVGRLIDRLREGGPAKFDPIAPPQSKPSESLSVSASVSNNSIAGLRTPAVIEMEHLVQALPAVSEESDPSRKAAVLLTVAAKAWLVAQLENAEASIYASQVEMLHYLNSRPQGEDAQRLKELFYNPANEKFPEIYRSYPFEGYLAFLQFSFFVAVSGTNVRLTPRGREYLLWRVEQHKVPRMAG